MRRKFLFQILGVMLAFLIVPAVTHAQDKTELLFDQFAGQWAAASNAFGKDVKSEMTWSRDLNGKFYRVDYIIDLKAPAPAAFRGVGYYKTGMDAAPEGFWADNSGDLHPLSSTIKGTTLTSIWGKAGGKMGRSEYRLRSDGKIEVTDWILTNKGWHQFNNTVFQKNESPN